MVVEVSTPDFANNQKVSNSKPAVSCAPLPVINAASSLAQELYYKILPGVRPPAKHRVIPDVTVTLTYHFEKVED